MAYTTSGEADVIYAHGASAAIRDLRVGRQLDDLRARWGTPSDSEADLRFYSTGTGWTVAVRVDSTDRVIQVGVIRLDPTPEPYAVPDSTDVFRVVAGTWDWKDAEGFCRSDPHAITFSPDRQYMIFRFAKPEKERTTGREVRYEIRGHTRSSIRGAILDETRRTETGELVVWDLVLTAPDTYRWHRTDWAPGGYTKEILRCPS